MRGGEYTIDGELCLSLEAVAEIYEVQTVWVRRVYDYGLLGPGRRTGTTVCIEVEKLDRVATIVRLHAVLGLELDAISLALDQD